MPKATPKPIPWGTKNCKVCGTPLLQTNSYASSWRAYNYKCKDCLHGKVPEPVVVQTGHAPPLPEPTTLPVPINFNFPPQTILHTTEIDKLLQDMQLLRRSKLYRQVLEEAAEETALENELNGEE